MDFLFDVLTELFAAEPMPSSRTRRLGKLTLIVFAISFVVLLTEIYLFHTSGKMGALGFLFAFGCALVTLVLAAVDTRKRRGSSGKKDASGRMSAE